MIQRVSSVSTNLVLTSRKALSLCLSVWWFGNGWNAELGLGASMVFLGSLFYTFMTANSSKKSEQPQAEPEVQIITVTGTAVQPETKSSKAKGKEKAL